MIHQQMHEEVPMLNLFFYNQPILQNIHFLHSNIFYHAQNLHHTILNPCVTTSMQKIIHDFIIYIII